MNMTRRFAVKAAFVAYLLALYLVTEVAARTYVVYGLGIAESEYGNFYRHDPDLQLLASGRHYRPHPYFSYTDPQRIRTLEQLREHRSDG